MNSAGTVQVAVRHTISDQVSGGVITPKTRTVTWSDSMFRITRPATGKHTVELDCPRCSASLLAQVRAEAWTRGVRTVQLVLAAVCLVLFVSALVYAVHEGGRTLPEGESSPALFPISIVAVFVTFVAAPLLYVRGRSYNGVSLLDVQPPGWHQIRPVRKAGTSTPGAASGR